MTILDTGHWTLDTGHWTLDTGQAMHPLELKHVGSGRCHVIETVIRDAVTYTDHAKRKTGLQFPVGRTHRLLRSVLLVHLPAPERLCRKGNYAQ